jgi:hypothetical protein
MESMLEKVSNSKNPFILQKAEEYPVLIQHQRPFKANSAMARIFMYVFPIGMIFKLISYLFERRISNDLLTIKKLNAELLQLIDEAVKADSIAV